MSIARSFLHTAAAVLALAFVPHAAPAQTLTQAAAEMACDQLSSNLFLQTFLSTPAGGVSTIDYSSAIDPGGTTFSYSTLPNQYFQGQPVSVSGSGSSVFSADGDTVTWESASVIIGDLVTYITLDSGTVTFNGGEWSLAYDLNEYVGDMKIGDTHIDIYDIFNLKEPTTPMGYLTDTNGNKVPNSDFKAVGTLNPLPMWSLNGSSTDANPAVPFNISTTGSIDPTTGLGNFEAVIAPEPATFALVAIMAPAILRRRRG